MDQTTKALAEFVATLSFDTLPAKVVHETKRRILDSIACAAGAVDYPLAQTIRQVARGRSAVMGARVWFSGAVSSPDLAGLANGTMVRYLDLSDTILSKAAGHPSDMIPALVALAEARQASGRTLIAAIAAAYALYGGLCDTVAFQKGGVDQSTAAALGAAAGASHILGLKPEETGQALSLAIGANVNLYNVRQGALSDWKALAGPNAARNGVFAAELAAEGLTGPSAVFDGIAGFKELVGAFDFIPSADLASRICDTHLKAFAVCYHGQSAVGAAIGLGVPIAANDIRSVRVETYDAAFRVMGSDASRWAPQNRETADHSIPFVVGMVLKTGGLRPDDYALEKLSDPALLDYLGKIEVVASEDFTRRYPKEARTRIVLSLTNGQERVSETVQPKGHVENPLSDAELETKLDALWPTSYDKARKAALIESVWTLEKMSDVTTLVDRLSGFIRG